MKLCSWLLSVIIFGLGLGLRIAVAADGKPESGKLEYNRDIRPIFSDTCFACHGPDGSKREADLRLDQRDGALKTLESGTAAIVPGKSAESELVNRITSTDPDVKMPPAEGIKKLSADQIELLKRWIDDGAEYQGHWSFLPIERPDAPEIRNPKSEIRNFNSIDQFVTAELERNGLPQSPQADPITLARRLALDLTGLPPTPEQVAMLVADPSDATYEKFVDQLLASPRYGERMAMW